MAPDSGWLYGNISVSWSLDNLYHFVMMQTVLMIIAVSGAAFYLGREFYLRFYAKEAKCDGCAVNKMMTDKK